MNNEEVESLTNKAFTAACKELASLHGCPAEIQYPNFELLGDCKKNCGKTENQEAFCWREIMMRKAKGEV